MNFKKFLFFLFICLTVIAGLVVYKVIKINSFYKQKGRINILVYSPEFFIYSIDLETDLDYVMPLELEYKINVPGGYGFYNIGALGKLSYLEKDPKIIKRAMSRLYSLPVDALFYKKIDKVYQDKDIEKNYQLSPLLLLSSFSDVDPLTKLYLVFKVLDLQKRDKKIIRLKKAVEKKKINQRRADEITKGLFLSSNFRQENKLVEIFSPSNSSGRNIGSLLEGVGINVFDFSQNKDSDKRCIVKEFTQKEISKTSEFIGKYFGCKIIIERTESELIDVKFFINNLDKKWK